jgi:hypothetical protein
MVYTGDPAAFGRGAGQEVGKGAGTVKMKPEAAMNFVRRMGRQQ